MPRGGKKKDRKRDKRKNKGKKKAAPVEDEKKQEEIPTDEYAKFRLVLGDSGWQPGPATLSKDVTIEGFRMLDPGGGKYLLDKTDIRIVEGTKYGLVGKNGAGKTTLLRKIVNYEIEEFPRHIRVMIVAQEQHLDDYTVLEAVLNADTVRQRIASEEERILELQAVTEDEDEQERYTEMLNVIYDIQADMEFDESLVEKKACQLLSGLGFTKEMMKAPTRSLSGGWRMRVNLAKALFIEPDLMLLDEPTNHLDFPTVLWLENYLKEYTKTVIIVSHDRAFLNTVCDVTVHLWGPKGEPATLSYYKGNYEAFEHQKEEKEAAQRNAYDAQQVDIREMQEFIEKMGKKGERRAAQVQSKKKMLDKVLADPIPEPLEEKKFSFKFPSIGKVEKKVCVMKDVSFGYTEDRILFRNV